MKILTNFPYSPFGRSAGSTQRFLQIILGLRELGHEIRLWSFKNPSGYQWADADLERAKQLGIEVILTPRGESFEPSVLDEVDAVWGIYFHYMKYYEGFNGPSLVDTHDLLTPNFQIDEYFSNFLSKDGEIFKFDREVFKEPFHTDFPIRDEELDVYRKIHPLMISLKEKEKLEKKKIKSTWLPYLVSLPDSVSDYSGRTLYLSSAHLNNLWGNDLLGTTPLPKIRLKAPNFEIDVMGEISDICRKFPAMNYTGYTENDDLLRSARFGLLPLVQGTGVQIKGFTYLSYGLPVVLFRHRAEPPFIHSENCFIAETIDEFAHYCLRLWNDVELCRVMGRNARESVENFYSKDRLLNDLQQIIKERLCK